MLKSLPFWSGVVVVTGVCSAALLTWAGKVDGQAFVGLVSTVIGGVIVHAAGKPEQPAA